MKSAAVALVCVFALALPSTSSAFGRGGGGGGGFRGGGGAPPARGGGGGGGFDLRRDTQPRPSTQPSRPTGNQSVNRPPNNNVNNRANINNNNNNNRTNINSNNRTNINNVNVNRNVVVSNPIYRGPAYGWNHGVVWGPVGGYWGGGFWGSLAIGVTSAAVGAAVYGSIVNSSHQTVTSYQVQPNSPGATLLSNYRLTQTQCGPGNLVVIYGPNDSVICALPNDLVTAGNYTLDTAQLSLVSQ